MKNPALYLHTDAYDTATGRLLGRHSAGESFLRGFLRHADVDRYWFFDPMNSQKAQLEALVNRIGPPEKPVDWIVGANRGRLEQVGVLNIPAPEITTEAWTRRDHGATRYAICGLTHTTATATVMRIVSDLMIAPLRDHDALICTSSAVRDSVETQLSMMRDYMLTLYGQRAIPEVQRVTIPLGLNAQDFATSAEQRKRWREKLDIPEDAIVALYVGRFNVVAKMNPGLMAMALERAAKRTGKRIYWVNSGWAESAKDEEVYHAGSRKLCPSVEYRNIDGRDPETRFSIWSVADFFISFSDNIQETFGLTPIEAMAAGLPCVVSDWNGYKDTVRDGIDGFRVPTVAPRSGLGGDLSYAFANHWITYGNYVGAAAQYVAVDLGAAENAIAALVESADLRRRMGAAAATQAREVFDWAAIIPQYQALWAEQDVRRRAAAPELTAAPSPVRPDPYHLFGNYPTRHLRRDDLISLQPGMDPAAAAARLAGPLASYSRYNRPTADEVRMVVEGLADGPPRPVATVLEAFPPARRLFLERGLLWLMRHDVVTIQPALPASA